MAYHRGSAGRLSAVTLVQDVEVDKDRVRGAGHVHVSHVLRRMHRRIADPAAAEHGRQGRHGCEGGRADVDDQMSATAGEVRGQPPGHRLEGLGGRAGRGQPTLTTTRSTPRRSARADSTSSLIETACPLAAIMSASRADVWAKGCHGSAYAEAPADDKDVGHHGADSATGTA